MRDRETIDSELRLLAAQRRAVRAHGGELSSHQLDRLLDERLGHPVEEPEATVFNEATKTGATRVVAKTWSPRRQAHDVTPYRRKPVLRRFGLLAALPLSLVGIAAAVVMMFAVRDRHPAADPPVDPPSAEQPSPAAQKPPGPSLNHAPPPGIVDKAFIEALQHEGVPVPSHDYATAQGHAVCDFLAQQPDFTEAVHFVQRSSIWDADQSADVAAGAVVSYCPQYQAATSDQMQQTFQNSLSKLQTIEGDLKGIHDDLQGIHDGLPPGS